MLVLTLWCVLWSLTTAYETPPRTICKLDSDHVMFCGNEVHYIGE